MLGMAYMCFKEETMHNVSITSPFFTMNFIHTGSMGTRHKGTSHKGARGYSLLRFFRTPMY
jgi:hypothetical protein